MLELQSKIAFFKEPSASFSINCDKNQLIVHVSKGLSVHLYNQYLPEIIDGNNDDFLKHVNSLSAENPCILVRFKVIDTNKERVIYYGIIKGIFNEEDVFEGLEINATRQETTRQEVEKENNDFAGLLIDTLFHNSNDFIGVFSLEKEVLYLQNKNFYEYLGYQFPSKTPFWHYADVLFHQDDVRNLNDLIKSLSVSTKKKWEVFLRCFHMNGQLRVFHLDIYRLDRFNKDERFIYVIKDVTNEEFYNHFIESDSLIGKALKRSTEADVFVLTENKDIILRLVNGELKKVKQEYELEEYFTSSKLPRKLQNFINDKVGKAFSGEVVSENLSHQGNQFSINISPLKRHGEVKKVVFVLDEKEKETSIIASKDLQIQNRSLKKNLGIYKQRYDVLLEEVQSLRISLDIQKSFFIKYNLEGGITYINKTFSDFLKLRPKELISGAKEPDILQEDLILYNSAMSKIRAFPFKEVKVDYRIRVNDKIYFTSWTISSLTDKSGNVLEYIASGMDVTPLMTHQERIQLSEERFRLISEATNEAIWDWNILTNDSWWNDTMYQLFSFSYNTKADINKWMKVILPEDREIVKGKMMDAISEKKTHWSCEFRVKLRGVSNIRYFYNRAYLNYNSDNMPERMLGSIMDITEKKLSVLRFQKLNDRFELAVKAGKTGIWQYQIQGDEFLFDKNLVALYKDIPSETEEDSLSSVFSENGNSSKSIQDEATFDVTDSEHISSFNFEKHIGRKAYSAFKKALLAYIDEENFTKPFEFIQKRKGIDKKIIWVLSRAIVDYNNEGQLEHIIGTDTDITDQKEAEEQMREAKTQTDESMRTQERFFSLMSHEIRSPLSGIIGMNELLLTQSPRSDQKEFLSAIKFSADNLLILINDLLDFSKIRAGKLDFEENDFDLHLLLKNTYLNYKTLTKDKNIEFEVQKLDILPKYIKGDVTRLSQILNNLLSNAIKFTSVGSVKLLVSILNETEKDISILFEVQDTGIGIPQNKQKKIFEPFAQASKDTSRKYGGTGLGLAIVKNLVELQGGELTFESQYGKGTTFRVSINYKKEQKKSGQQVGISFNKDLTHIRDFAGLNVLYVDDVVTNQLIMQGFASRWGIVLDTASDGFEGLHKAQEKNYELILMDLQMPGIDGYETTRRIRAFNDAYYKQVPIIALTADISLGVINDTENAGLTDYLSKPINFDKLYGLLKKHKITPKVPESFEQRSITVQPKDLLESDVNFQVVFRETDHLFEDDDDGYFDFLQKSAKEFMSNQKSLSHALRHHDLELFRQVHHKMHSLLTFMELNLFNNYLKELKNRFQSIEEEEMPSVLGKLDFFFSGILSEIKEKQSSIREKTQ